MGIIRKSSTSFIDDIPLSKLEGGIASDTIYSDANFRLDNQGTTTATADSPKMYNLQIQVNYYPEIRSLKPLAPRSIATAFVPIDGSWTAAQVKAELLAGLERWLQANGF